MAWNTKPQTGTKHKVDCKMAFGRKDATCPRCQELLNGSAPRKSWGHSKKENEARFLRSLKAHNCESSNCGPVCTFGDW